MMMILHFVALQVATLQRFFALFLKNSLQDPIVFNALVMTHEQSCSFFMIQSCWLLSQLW